MSFQINHPNYQLFEEIIVEETGLKQVLWPTHCVGGEKGAEFHPDLQIADTDIIKQKGKLELIDSYSGFGNPPEDSGLLEYLKKKNITKCFIAGLAYEFCVGNTALDSVKHGFKTFFIQDAARGISQEGITAMDEELQQAGVQIIDSSHI